MSNMFLGDYIIILYIMKTQEVLFSVRRYLGNVRSKIALRRKELFEDSRKKKTHTPHFPDTIPSFSFFALRSLFLFLDFISIISGDCI